MQEIKLKDAGADIVKVLAEVNARFEQLDLSSELPVDTDRPAWQIVVESPIVREKLLKMADLGWSLFAIQRTIHERLSIKLSRPEVGRMLRQVIGAERYATQYGNRYLFENLGSRPRKPAQDSSPAPAPSSEPSQEPASESWF